MWLKTVKKMCKPQNTCALPIFRHQELMKRTIHSALRVFILTIMGLNKQGKGFDWLATSFPGSCLFLPRGRKRQDPGNEVDSHNACLYTCYPRRSTKFPGWGSKISWGQQSRTSSLRSLLGMLAWRNERLSKDSFEGGRFDCLFKNNANDRN